VSRAGGTAITAAGRYVAPRLPRRVSGPARKPSAGKPPAARPRAAARPADPLALRLLRRGQALADSRLLDRLVRGRLWIPLVAIALVGVVFMQVSMLRLNAGIGRDVEAIGSLQRDNAVLRADVSRMESGERVQSVAHDLGMVVPADGSFRYVPAGAANAGALAAARMQPADPEALARAQAEALANAQAQAAAPAGATTPSIVPGATGAPVATVVPAATTGTTAEPAATTTAGAPPATTTPGATAPATTAAPAATAGGAAAPTGAQG
jgi:hypothetical protein